MEEIRWKRFINAKVTASVVLISSWHFSRWDWWKVASQSKGGNWSLVVPCLCDKGKVLLITLVVDLGNSGWPRRPQDLPLQGVIFHSTSLFTHIHTLGLGPSFKKWSVGPFALGLSSCLSPHTFVLIFFFLNILILGVGEIWVLDVFNIENIKKCQLVKLQGYWLFSLID